MLAVSQCPPCVQRNLLPVSYPAAFFVQLLINPRQLCLVAIDCGTIIGFASAAMGPSQPTADIGYVEDDCTAEESTSHADRKSSELRSEMLRSHVTVTLLTLGVMPAYQRRGIGRVLVHGVVQRLEASCAAAAQSYQPTSSEHQDTKIAVLVQVQVAQSNSAGKDFYTQLGMMDQRGCDDVWLRLGPGPRTSVMAGVLCV